MKGNVTSERWFVSVAWILIVAGVLVRTAVYASGRPLWLDEAMLSLNIASRSYAALLQPLDYNQWAPAVVLWAMRLAVELGGVTEWTLRIWPYLCGVGLLLLAWPLARTWLGERDATVAVALLASHMGLVYYSAEVKQYGVDAFVTVGLLGLLARVIERPASGVRWALLVCGGLLGVLVSLSAAFVLMGVMAALIVSVQVKQVAGWRVRVAVATLTWAMVCGALVVLGYRRAASDPYLIQYWEGSNLLFALRSGRTWLLIAVSSVGIGGLLARGRTDAAAALGTPCLALAAAGILDAYPMESRLLLFLVPITCLCLAAAVGWLLDLAPERIRGFALAIILLVIVGYQGRRLAHRLPNRGDSRELVRMVESRRGSDPVYVNAFGIPAWSFYTTDWTKPDTVTLKWIARVASAGGPAFGNASSRGHRVSAEGYGLQYVSPGGLTLLGVPAGMEFRNAHGDLRNKPDPGWAANEAARLQAVATPFAWIFFSHYRRVQTRELLEAIGSMGGVVLESFTRRGTAVFRVCLPGRSGATQPSGVVQNAAPREPRVSLCAGP